MKVPLTLLALIISVAMAAQASNELLTVQDYLLDRKEIGNRSVTIKGVALCIGADTCFM